MPLAADPADSVKMRVLVLPEDLRHGLLAIEQLQYSRCLDGAAISSGFAELTSPDVAQNIVFDPATG